jgi:guanylate kinase
VLINNDIDQSLSHVRAILQAERLRRQRQVGLNEFVADLRRGV